MSVDHRRPVSRPVPINGFPYLRDRIRSDFCLGGFLTWNASNWVAAGTDGRTKFRHIQDMYSEIVFLRRSPPAGHPVSSRTRGTSAAADASKVLSRRHGECRQSEYVDRIRNQMHVESVRTQIGTVRRKPTTSSSLSDHLGPSGFTDVYDSSTAAFNTGRIRQRSVEGHRRARPQFVLWR